MISKNQSSNPEELKYFENELTNQRNIIRNIQKENKELCKRISSFDLSIQVRS